MPWSYSLVCRFLPPTPMPSSWSSPSRWSAWHSRWVPYPPHCTSRVEWFSIFCDFSKLNTLLWIMYLYFYEFSSNKSAGRGKVSFFITGSGTLTFIFYLHLPFFYLKEVEEQSPKRKKRKKTFCRCPKWKKLFLYLGKWKKNRFSFIFSF